MRSTTTTRAGFTLLELILSIGLMSVLVVALVGLLDTALDLWGRTEQRRDLVEMSTAVADMLERDLSTLDGGRRGDLLAEWVLLDGDGDGTSGALYPRLRLVRRVSPAELARIQAGAEQPVLGEGLVEVAWAVLPRSVKSPAATGDLMLWRGERVVGDESTVSVFDPRFFDDAGRPVPGALSQVTGGVLWLELAFATQTSILQAGWSFGDGLRDCARSWDAWKRARPDVQQHVWNQAGAGMPDASDTPLLPRRVRVELELERDADAVRRTHLVAAVDNQDTTIVVRDGNRVPETGTLIRVDEEWMLVQSKTGKRVTVRRGQRGTVPLGHAPGAKLHYGEPIVREIPIALHREDWNL